MKRLVLSGINLFTGGTLQIYKKLIEQLGKKGYDKKYKIVAFVHKKEYFDEIKCHVKYIEIPDGRNYLKRMYYEEVFFYKWSKDKHIDIWIAMHDLSPKVVAKKRYTYYHTPQIFYNMPFLKAVLDLRCFLRSKFYRYFVATHVKETTGVIVQAHWIKEKFEQMFKGCNIIVARPEETEAASVPRVYFHKEYTFFYPSFPRVFKNFEVICEACRILNRKDFEYKVLITIKGNENRYAKWLYRKYGDVKNIKWLGILERKEIEKIYQEADVLIFSSTLETWGLPVTEWGKYGKPMILADLPYAYETAANEKLKVFFKADDAKKLAEIMAAQICGKFMEYEDVAVGREEKLDEWERLLAIMLD